MKKLFTLIALLALCFGAQAKTVIDKEFVYGVDMTEWNLYKMGFAPQIRDGVLWSNPSVHNWDSDAGDYSTETAGWYQFFMMPAFAGEPYTNYDVTFTIKGSAAGNFNVNLRWSWSEDAVNAEGSFTTDWSDVTLSYDPVNGSNIDLIFQSSFQGDIEIQKIVISHDEKESRPVEWIELLENGNAEGEFGEVPCAYSKEFNRYQREDGMPENEPYPCDIEDDGTGNKVFVVHAKQVNKDDFAEGAQYYEYPGGKATGAYEWMNQFWLQSPKSWKSGEQVKISFRYKADKAVTANTQCHAEKPGSYLHWQAIGDINFTEDWQTFENTFTIPDAGNGMWSVAFNLKEVDTDVTYYFDDLSWQEMKLDHGYFAAASNTETGIDYDFDNAIEFVDGEDGLIVATVGTVGKEDSWVNEVMISTVRGNDKAYKSGTIKPTATIVGGEDDWIDYVSGSNYKIKLPAAGVWQISLDTEAAQINFVQLEGEAPQELVDIKANPTEITVEGVERDWKAEGEDGVGEGQPWDNQFWILANRALAAGEETYIEFEYKSSVPAKTTTQCHGDIANGGNYIHWAAIGDVNFDTEWNTFSTTFTVPSEADGMQSIAFNMAEIKEACNYEIKNVIWCVGSKEASYESLIDMEAANKNFWAKVGAGTNPYNWAEGPTGINSVVNSNTGSAAIYNLAGQRVSNTYKGIVVKEGKKYLVK